MKTYFYFMLGPFKDSQRFVLEQGFLKDFSGFGCNHPSLHCDQPAAEKMLHNVMVPPPCSTVKIKLAR